jgi:glycine hydroxymethyltransferase
MKDFFNTSLATKDPEVFQSIEKEMDRQQHNIELIASENIVSRAVLEAQGSILTNKYAEGYAGRRYYGGCEYVDISETLAIERAKKLFGVNFANVQPHSGSQANQGVFLSLLQPNDTILGMSLDSGGHLTHGARVNLSGKWFNAAHYNVSKETGLIDLAEVEALALEHKPKLIIAGGSAYPRIIDFAAFRKIADKVGAYFLVDMAHFAGLVAGGHYPSPVPHAHVMTTTTHKTLRGPRGGMILTNDEDLAKKINSAIFPGLQGGPLMHVIAAKAVAFGEALQPEYKEYTRKIIENCQVLSSELVKRGFTIFTGGTDSHLLVVDLRPIKLTGKAAEQSLDRAGLTCNKNSIPFDTEKPMVTSGIRLGTAAGTTRGFGVAEFKQIANLISDVIDGLKSNPEDNTLAESKAKEQVRALCAKFPIYQ